MRNEALLGAGSREVAALVAAHHHDTIRLKVTRARSAAGVLQSLLNDCVRHVANALAARTGAVGDQVKERARWRFLWRSVLLAA